MTNDTSIIFLVILVCHAAHTVINENVRRTLQLRLLHKVLSEQRENINWGEIECDGFILDFFGVCITPGETVKKTERRLEK